MQSNRVKNYWIKSLCIMVILYSPVQGIYSSPWATPDDVLIRHDLQILTDNQILSIPINTWPIAWGDVAYNLKIENLQKLSPEVLFSLQRVRQRLIQEELGGLSANAEIKYVKNPDSIMTFFDLPNTKKLVGSTTSYMSKNIAINLKFEKTEKGQLLDESYVSLARGNYSLTLGSKKNWWGPGWMGSMAMSSNSRPIKAISIERNFSDPFENQFLSILGSWDMAFIMGDIKNTDFTPDRRFSALRMSIRPKNNLEVGFSKSAVICDKDNSCGFSEIIDGLKGSNNTYDLTTIDYRASSSFMDIPYASYGQISGTSLDKSLGLFGIETWGNMESIERFQSYRVFAEFASTTCGIFGGQSKYGCAYQNKEYPSAYLNRGNNIGYPLDGDSIAISFGGIIVLDDTQLYKSSLAIGRINRGSEDAYQFKQSATDFLNFNLGYQFDLYWYDIALGSFDLGLGFDVYKDKVSGNTEKDPRLYVAWKNSIDLSEQKVRDYSEYIEYIELIEVNEEIIEPSNENNESIIQYVSYNEKDLTSIISLINETSFQRGDISFDDYSPKIVSSEEIIDQLSQSTDTNNLSDYLSAMDETISQRN